MRSIPFGVLCVTFCGAFSMAVIAQQGPPGGNPGPPGVNALTDLTAAQQAAFNRGRQTFAKNYQVADGLGPVFNDQSCNACHRGGAGSNDTVQRIGRVDARGAFDALSEVGGSLLQSRGIGLTTSTAGTHNFVGERPPGTANITALRRAHGVQGLGFVDAVADAGWQALADAQRNADPATAGRTNTVMNLSTGRLSVGKFGWKAQVPTLLQFAADALLNEMGITNPLFRNEVCPQGDCWTLDYNPAPVLNDDGRDVDALSDFVTLLAAPARGAITTEVVAGEQVFSQIGCASCHAPTIRTGASTIAALDRAEFHPYSDFLLHEMGALGDGIEQGTATGREMRTQPLWGLRNATRFMHDAASRTLEDAVRRHDGQGARSRDQFVTLPAEPLAQLLAFLRSL